METEVIITKGGPEWSSDDCKRFAEFILLLDKIDKEHQAELKAGDDELAN